MHIAEASFAASAQHKRSANSAMKIMINIIILIIICEAHAMHNCIAIVRRECAAQAKRE